MRGRNDGGAQKRRVLVTVCTLLLMFSLISLYHGSFFSNRRNKLAVPDSFDPTASSWSANLAADPKEGAADKDRLSEKIDTNGDGSESFEVEQSEDETASDGDTSKVLPVSSAVFFS